MNTIIENYFKITGRPIATMTVSEYLEFCRFSPDVNSVTTNKKTEPVVAPVREEKKAPVIKEKTSTNPEPLSEPSRKTALDMLKSVSG